MRLTRKLPPTRKGTIILCLVVGTLTALWAPQGFGQALGQTRVLVPDKGFRPAAAQIIGQATKTLDIVTSSPTIDPLIAQAIAARTAAVPNLRVRVKTNSGGLNLLSGDQETVLVGTTLLNPTSMEETNETNFVTPSQTLGASLAPYLDRIFAPTATNGFGVSDGGISISTKVTFNDLLLAEIARATTTIDLNLPVAIDDTTLADVADALVTAKGKNVLIRVVGPADSVGILKNNGITSAYSYEGAKNSRSAFVVRDQSEVLLGSDGAAVTATDAALAHSLSIYFSQKIAYGTRRDPVPPRRRFWIGYKIPTLSDADFDAALNAHLIPDTVRVAAQRGLLGYSPVITGEKNQPSLPDEFAVVSYLDDETYRAIADTPAGAAYQASHWNFFIHQTPDGFKSGSQLTAPFTGAVAFGNAYTISPDNTRLEGGAQTYSILQRKTGQSDGDFLTAAAGYIQSLRQFESVGLVDSAVRVEQNFLLEFQIWKTDAARAKIDTSLASLRVGSFDVFRAGNLPQQTISGSTPLVSPEQGVTFQFDTRLLNSEKIYSALRRFFAVPLQLSTQRRNSLTDMLDSRNNDEKREAICRGDADRVM